ncbi:hypothetical protein [Pseudovibrio denitrificans]|uniref:hypothetical protein n=1 Tax=Pseudovibrio denitrificans TaxID=258256 RepID=UPI000A657E60|nr:hypothetical protein [Pseudovibrio denitrificans]
MANRYSKKLDNADLGEKLESAILQTFVKSMLPKEMETVYGGGTAGTMWKGLMLSNSPTNWPNPDLSVWLRCFCRIPFVQLSLKKRHKCLK